MIAENHFRDFIISYLYFSLLTILIHAILYNLIIFMATLLNHILVIIINFPFLIISNLL